MSSLEYTERPRISSHLVRDGAFCNASLKGLSLLLGSLTGCIRWSPLWARADLERAGDFCRFDARARGKRNPHATRIVARAWIRVIWACWHTDVPYGPASHHARQRPTG
jgi:hypothetical protein